MTWIKSKRRAAAQAGPEFPEVGLMVKKTSTTARRATARRSTTPASSQASKARKVANVKSTSRAAVKNTGRVSGSRALVEAAPSRDAPSWTETLSDGTHVIIRPIHKEDAALERAFIKRLSPESRRLRFLGQMNEASDEFVRALTDIDYKRDMAFVALVHRDGEKREIGVARYGTSADGTTCECAVAVADEWRNRGLGVLLMRHLIDVARSRGVRSMFSIDEADNAAMSDLARFLGFRRRRDPNDATLVVHTLGLR
jgi:GNAT superfamily N-acetyltransferase